MPLPRLKNPWVILSESIEFENPWLKLTNYKTQNPKGDPADYGVVHFKNRAVGVIPYADGYVWMVGQTRFALGQYSWEIPEGGCPEGESLIETAHRELKEETGITAAQMQPLLKLHTSNSVTDEYGEIFLATDLTFGPAQHEDSEDITVEKFTLDALCAFIDQGEITDLMTIAAIHKLKLMQLSGEIS